MDATTEKDVVTQTIEDDGLEDLPGFLGDNGPFGIAEALSRGPGLLREIRGMVWQADLDAVRARELVRRVEMFVAADVAAQTREDGKPAFGNEALRRAEVARRLVTDEAHLAALESAEAADEDAATLKGDAEYHVRVLESARAMAAAGMGHHGFPGFPEEPGENAEPSDGADGAYESKA
jgi:hypothetical protein